ncbi:MAG: hypothetical protein PVI90_07100 [Desulfobacteraceae bacterium]|jgi:hypothetical protein
MTIVGGNIIGAVTGGLLISSPVYVQDPGIPQDEDLAAVQELIQDSGRQITFIRFKQDPQESDKPWKGPVDPRTIPDAVITLWGVFIQPAGMYDLGFDAVDQDLLKKVKAICLVAPESANPAFDIATADELLDGTEYKKIEFVKTLRPSATTLLYYVGISE